MSWYWFECPKYFSIIRIHIRISLSILFSQFLLTKRQLANVALSNFLKISKIMCGNLAQILSIIVSCTYGVCKRIILKSGKKCYLLFRVKERQDNFCKQSKPTFTKPWWKHKLSPTYVLMLSTYALGTLLFISLYIWPKISLKLRLWFWIKRLIIGNKQKWFYKNQSIYS